MSCLPSLPEFLESLGFEFHLDFDRQLIIEYPEELTVQDMAIALGPLSGGIREHLEGRQRIAMHTCMGGPLDGKPHMWPYWNSRKIYAVRVKRAHWAAYRLQRDGRAIFQGYATSQKKARQGEFSKPAVKS